jgi:hypothetical protein
MLLDGVAHLAPVGRDHVHRRRQSGALHNIGYADTDGTPLQHNPPLLKADLHGHAGPKRKAPFA